MGERQAILIVDDEERNVRLLKAMLARENYRFICAFSGEEALKVTSEDRPDIILLDVMMPGMDGFEVCRKIKHHEDTRMIPIVMVTALSEKDDRIRAMKAGADDFISKPVDQTELLLRVKSLLRIKGYHDALMKSHSEISEKNRNLTELERFKEDLTHMLVHDLNNPLFSLYMALEILLSENENFSEKQIKTMSDCVENTRELKDLVRDILDIHKMDSDKLQPARELTNMVDLIESATDIFKPKIDAGQILLSFSNKEDMPSVSVDPGLMKRVMTNLIGNAVRHTPVGGEIEIRMNNNYENENLHISVKDTGDGLPPEYHRKVFDKFQQVEIKKAGVMTGISGLGLPFCKLAVEAHQGQIWVESEGQGKGCTFHLTIPVTGSGSNTKSD